MRLDRINPAMINGFVAKRKAEGVSARTVNLEITVFRNVMKRALYDDKWITRLPTDNLRPLKTKPRKRPLVTPAEIERICSAASQPVFSEGKVVESANGKPLANAQEFADFIKLMSMSGGRASETLRLKKTDVDWLNRQLTFGSDGLAKNGKIRRVDFNPKLEAT